jgi:nitrate reductase beta subunit
VDEQRELIVDPFDPEIVRQAVANGIRPDVIEAAQKSPVYKFVKLWKLALPPHIEYRTLPMLFYVPPLLPVLSSFDGTTLQNLNEGIFPDFAKARSSIDYLANLFAAGNPGKVRYVLRKLMAVRTYRRALTVADVTSAHAARLLTEADCSPEEAEAIYRLTSLARLEERFVIPPAHREEAVAMLADPLDHKRETGFGFRRSPRRGA